MRASTHPQSRFPPASTPRSPSLAWEAPWWACSTSMNTLPWQAPRARRSTSAASWAAQHVRGPASWALSVLRRRRDAPLHTRRSSSSVVRVTRCVAAVLRCTHHSHGVLQVCPPPVHQWQLCKTCNSQLYNITASGHNKRTTELTNELRAQLGGSEYLLSTVAPRLGPQELRAFIAFLVSSAAAALSGTVLADAMVQRPWARSAVYAAPATRAALRTVHAALVVAQTDPRLVCCPGCTCTAHERRATSGPGLCAACPLPMAC